MKRFLSLGMIMVVLAMVLAGCAGGTGDSGTTESKEVKLGAVNWAEGIAMTNLAKAVLEEKMGYSVEITVADVAPIFASVASGDYDAFMDAWLPLTHETYMEEYGDKLVDLGHNFEGAKIGLVVPSYVDIDSIEEMNANADKFAGQIVGIDAGAGIMKATETVISDYELSDIELMASSGPMMTAALKKAVDEGEWVAVTGWKPHWKFARWDLKFLDDPKGDFGEAENIHTVARVGLKEDMPEVASFLENFMLDDQQLGGLMGMIADSEDMEPIDVAKQWMEENEELVNSWIE